jgi:hypothetical protein
LEAIVSFWTAYGPVRKFVSDNGSNFKKTAKTLEEDYETAQMFQSQPRLLGRKLSEIYRVEWQFIPAHAPWMGGMYERLIKEVKSALSSTLQRRKINRIELNIAVQEAAHRINCRPLTESSIDAMDGEILTPHHLAKNKSGWPLLPGLHKDVYKNVDDKSIYRRGRIVADEILKKFTARYLPVLTKQTKWHKEEPPAKVGDLVLVIEPNQTRRQWKRGKIVKVHVGRDRIVRVVDVELAGGVLKKNRAVRNLAKIEISTSLAGNDETVMVNVFFEYEFDFLSANFTFYIQKDHSRSEENLIKMAHYPCKSRKIETKRHHWNVMQLENVPEDLKLSEIVQMLAPNFKNIISIFRQYDFKQKRASQIVYLELLDNEEYDKAIEVRTRVSRGPGVHATFPDLIFASAYFRTALQRVDNMTIEDDPKPLCIANLPKLEGDTSLFAARVLKAFENKIPVCGMKWVRENVRTKTRTFGFINTDSRDNVAKAINSTFSVNGLSIKVDWTDSVTVLMRRADLHLVSDYRKAILSPSITGANWLCCRVSNHAIQEPEEPFEASADIEMENDTIPLTKDGEKTPNRDENVLELANDIDLSDLVDDEMIPSPNATFAQTVNEDKANRGKYLKLFFKGKFVIKEFREKVLKAVPDYIICVFIDYREQSNAYLEFADSEKATECKEILSHISDIKSVCKIKYSNAKGKKKCDKAQNLKLKAKGDEIIFVCRPEGTIMRKMTNSNWTMMNAVFPPGECE